MFDAKCFHDHHATWVFSRFRFDPTRFEDEEVQNRPSLAFCPFGIGQRKCVGYRVAEFETIAVLFCIIRKFEILLAPIDQNFTVEPKHGFVIKPETEIWIQVKKRTGS